MPTVINNPNPTPTTADSGWGFAIGLIILVVLVILFFVYGLPAIRGENEKNNTEINVPDRINVNLDQDNTSPAY